MNYAQVWNHPEYRVAAPGEDLAWLFMETAKPDGEVIDFGCGTGRGAEIISQHVPVLMLDIAENCLDAPAAGNRRFEVHDLTHPIADRAEYGYCTDVMEHIAPDDVDTVLRNVLESARNVFFSISTVPDHFGPVLTGEPLHLTVQPFDWWLAKLRDDHCCRVLWQRDAGNAALFYVSAYANGDDFAARGRMNTADDALRANIRRNLDLGLREARPHQRQDTQIMVLAGGPSLADHEQEIVERGRAGELIVTVNGTYNWLIERGIRPAAQVMLDARGFNRRFLMPVVDTCLYLLCSQCDHDAVTAVPRDQVMLWHSGDSDLVKQEHEEHAKRAGRDHEWYPVYGGTTVMLRALPLLSMLGFRKIEIFGWDSCLRNGSHHAYAQPENDGAKVFEVLCGGRRFSAHSWMIIQANELVRIVRHILGHIEGFEMAVRGDGLIAHMLQHAAEMAEKQE